MTDLIDRIYFQELAEQNPREVCQRAGCTYNEKEKFYTLPVWESLYRIYPHEGRIIGSTPKGPHLHSYFDLFMIHYLLGAKEIDVANQWISEKDIPGGATFFRGPHAIPTQMIAGLFDGNIEGFTRQCELFGGEVLALADAAFSFRITAKIPVALLYWAGDAEFPTEAKLLFDNTICAHLALDIIYALAVGVCQRLGQLPE